jgi:very-short-patch-repair endonuclease
VYLFNGEVVALFRIIAGMVPFLGPKAQYPATMEDPKDKLPMHQGAKPRIFGYARKNREQNTEAEKVLWEALRLKKLDGFRFRNQHPIGKYIADFYCHSARLAIEVDGGYHLKKEQREYDAGKELDIESSGVKVLRFKNEDVLNELPKVLKIIRFHLPNTADPTHP